MKRTPMKPRSRTLSRSSGIAKKNAKRRQSEFQRTYHSKARVAFVKGLPCVVCGISPCDNAHIEGGGMGRKADYDKIVPLCRVPADHPFGPGYSRGHHSRFHDVGVKTFAADYRLDLPALAAETERKWQAHCAARRTTET